MTRKEHMAWCKQRANALIDAGDLQGAYSSMIQDLALHEECGGFADVHVLGMQQMLAGHLSTPEQMREWVNGYH